MEGSLKTPKTAVPDQKIQKKSKNLVVFVRRLATELILAAMNYHLTNGKALVLAVKLAHREYALLVVP